MLPGIKGKTIKHLLKLEVTTCSQSQGGLKGAHSADRPKGRQASASFSTFAKRDAVLPHSLVISQDLEHLFAFKKPLWNFSFYYPGTKVAFWKSGAKALQYLTHKSVTANSARQRRMAEPRVFTNIASTTPCVPGVTLITPKTLKIDLFAHESSTRRLIYCTAVNGSTVLHALPMKTIPVAAKDIRKDDCFQIAFQRSGSCHNI